MRAPDAGPPTCVPCLYHARARENQVSGTRRPTQRHNLQRVRIEPARLEEAVADRIYANRHDNSRA